ncbi:MAG: hypothetical protein IKH54_03470 [Bacilli bacterium]|nr:hypothetical protein [Bacilli bacterium]
MKKNIRAEKDFDPFIDKKKKKIKDLELEDEKEVKVKEKKVVKVKTKKPKKARKKINLNLDRTDIILVIVLVLLAILNIFLTVKVIKQSKLEKEQVHTMITIPVLGEQTNNEISVDIANMKKGETKDYSFKVANNKDNNINQEEVIYGLQLVYEDGIEVEVYKNDNNDNILPKNNIILDNKLKAKEEQEDIYTLKIKANKKTEDKKLLTIKVIS